MTDRAQTPRRGAARRGPSGYRPHLDGVRALAVTLVILFHLGYPWMPGGFIGVDVFFVLSGYLITGLLLREVAERGRVDLVRFYSRRVRRLLPAATVVLLAVLAMSLWLLDAVDRNAVGGDLSSSALYVANWHFISSGADYFAPGDVPSPLVHFWSLAVEEQFYLVWPALFFGLWFAVARFARHREGDGSPGVLIGVAVIAAVSIVLSLVLVPSTNAYYSTFTRAYELCTGAMLAVAARRYAGSAPDTRLMRGAGAVAVLVGLAALVVLAMTIPDATDYPGTAALMVTGSTLLVLFALEFLPIGAGHKALGQAAPAAVGRISYGLYLWHWPVIVFAPLLAAKLAIDAPRYRGVQIAAIVALSTLSFFIVESPVRFRLGRLVRPALVVGAGLAVSVTVALVAPRYLKPQDAYGQKALAAVLDLAKPENCPYFPEEWGDPSDDAPCVYRKGGPRVIAFVGDSHAQQWQPAIKAMAERDDLTVVRATRGGCPANWVTTYTYDEQGISRPDTDCDRWRARVYRDLVKRYDPELIYVATRSQEKGLRDGERSVNKNKPDHLRLWAAGWGETMRTLTAGTGRVVVARLLPTLPWRVPACLATASSATQARTCDSRVTIDKRIPRYNRVIEGLPARFPRVAVVDPTPIVCPRGACPAVENGIIVHRDDNHVSATFARSVAEQFQAMLRTSGAFSPTRTARARPSSSSAAGAGATPVALWDATPVAEVHAAATPRRPLFGKPALKAILDLAKPGVCPYFPKEFGPGTKDDEPCVYRKGGPRVVAYVGDSHAQQWQPALDVLARRYNLTLVRATRGGCPANWVTGYTYDQQRNRVPDTYCERWRARVYPALVRRYDPELIFVATRSQVKGLSSGGREIDRRDPRHLRLWAGGWDRTMRTLTAGSGTVVVSRLVPTLPWRVPVCLSAVASLAQTRRCNAPVSVDRRIPRYNRVIDRLQARSRDVRVVNPVSIICSRGVCPAVMNGAIVHRDDNHMTATFSRSIARPFEALLVRAGAFTPSRVSGRLQVAWRGVRLPPLTRTAAVRR